MDPLDVYLEALRLKALPRAGWVKRHVPGPESVAAHSWGISWLVLALMPRHLERGKALAYAALHDLPEVRVGDLTPSDPVSKEEKARREHDAMAQMSAALGSAELLQIYEAYEAQGDPEARFVKELDRLDMALQALAYHEAGAAGMLEFVDSADRVVRDPVLRPWMERIRVRMTTPRR